MLAENSAETPENNDRAPLPPTRPGVRVIASEDLMAGQKELLIAHGEEVYRLRLTRSGKLILHK